MLLLDCMPVCGILDKIIIGVFQRTGTLFRIEKVNCSKIILNMRVKRLAVWFTLLGALPQAVSAFEVQVQGVSGDVRANVEALLGPVRENSITEIRQTYRAQVDRAITRALQALGYYQSIVHYSWREAKGKGFHSFESMVYL